MVDRATGHQNAIRQIQETTRPGQAVDIPDNTQERQVKNVRSFIACLCPLTGP
jgi:hypothetical protein